MKIFSWGAFVSLLMLANSCELVDKVEDIGFDITVPVNFIVNDPTNNPSGKSYSEVQTLNPANDPDVIAFGTDIRGYEINKITYLISNASPNTSSFEGGVLKVSATDKTFATIGTVNLNNLNETELNLNEDGIKELASRLLDDNQEIVLLQGSHSKTPIAFTISFKFFLTIRADASK